MDRTLQTALEKRNRVGAWQSRVYRLERGYLSTWPDVVSAAAKKEPRRTECLFHGNQVAVVSDQGDRRFRIEFPWDSSGTLLLRASDVLMKKSWMKLLNSTVKEAASQIDGTGSVFAYGGIAQHREDEAYEEAAFLKTNRFLAAYVVDTSSRASYVNDHLNEHFQHEPHGGNDAEAVTRVCVGAEAVIEELLALMQDFTEEMQGVQELRQGSRQGELDPKVAAPKISRFCEDYLSLAGRLVVSRLTLEITPFLDASTAESSEESVSATRARLTSIQGKLDEMYAKAQDLAVCGNRKWLLDIRGTFSDCLDRMSATSAPSLTTETRESHSFTAVNPAPEEFPSPPDESTAVRRPSKLLFASAMSAARAATETFTGGSKSEPQGEADATQTEQGGGSSSLSSLFGGLSIGTLRRGSRTEKSQGNDQVAKQSPATSPRRQFGSSLWGDKPSRASPESELMAPVVLDGQAHQEASNPSFSSDSALARRPREPSKQERAEEDTGVYSPALPVGSDTVPPVHTSGMPGNSTSYTGEVKSAVPTGTAGRKGKRAFAGGLWHAKQDPAADHARDTSPARKFVPQAVPAHEELSASAPDRSAMLTKAASSGEGKRRFAGGSMAVERRPSASIQRDNPFGASAAAGPRSPRNVQGGDNPFGANAAESWPSAKSQGDGPFGGSSGNRAQISLSERDASSAPQTKPTSWERAGAAVANKSPGWASGNEAVPSWANDGGAVTGPQASEGSSGVGLAPPSRPDPASEATGKKSPFMASDVDVPVSRPRQLRRPGGTGSRRAFGGE